MTALQAGSVARGDLYFDIHPATTVDGVPIPAYAELKLRVGKLAGSTNYRLRANGVDQATITTRKRGGANVTFAVLAGDGSQPVLDFDPRGMLISVSSTSGTDLLSAVLYGPLEPPTTSFEEQVELTPRPSAGGATAKASYRTGKKGSRSLAIEVRDLPEGDYSVRIDKTLRGTLSVTSQRKHTAGKFSLATHATKKRAAGLNVDPRGLQVDLVGNTGTVFSGVMQAALPGSSSAPPASVATVSLTLRIPDYETSHVAGLNVWRLDDRGNKYQQVERILIWPPRKIGGSEVVDYSFLALDSNTISSGKFVAPVQRGQSGNAVTFTLDFDRPAPAAFFKISTFNSAGESPRSKTALRR